MHSLNYLSYQLDVLASTPPSTPSSRSSHFTSPSTRPPRAKSYGRIFPSRRPSQQGQAQSTTDGTSVSFLNHASKRSFSSPALWSFRKPGLSPTTSFVGTPTGGLKRKSSYEFPAEASAPTADDEKTKSGLLPESSTLATRGLLWGMLVSVWEVLCAVWFGIYGLFSIPGFLVPNKEVERNRQRENEVDTGDESDDGIVARASKRSIDQAPSYSSTSPLFDTNQPPASLMATLVQETLTSAQGVGTTGGIGGGGSILGPPTPEEVQERTETPHIDLVPPTPGIKQPAHRPTASLLPNPLSSSLLTRSTTSPPATTYHQPYSSMSSPKKPPGLHLPKTLVLDLDETLIHSTSKALRAHSGGGLFSMGGFGFGFGDRRGYGGSNAMGAGHMVEVVLGGRCTLYHVYKRPFVDYFLRKVSSWYTLVIFTASMQEYADPVIDWLDAGRGIISRRFFRESCTRLSNGSYTKDLSLVEPDLSRVCLIDNSPVSYNVNPANGIPIEGWISDPSDEALLHLLPVLDSLRFASDVRRILGIRLFN